MSHLRVVEHREVGESGVDANVGALSQQLSDSLNSCLPTLRCKLYSQATMTTEQAEAIPARQQAASRSRKEEIIKCIPGSAKEQVSFVAGTTLLLMLKQPASWQNKYQVDLGIGYPQYCLHSLPLFL